MQLRREADIFKCRILREQIELLKHKSEALLHIGSYYRRLLAVTAENRFAVYADLAAVGRFKEIKATQKRCLAAAG